MNDYGEKFSGKHLMFPYFTLSAFLIFTAAVEKRLKYISISFIILCHAYYIFSKNIIYFLLCLVRFFHSSLDFLKDDSNY